ncbi:TPA: hypothetical protein ACNUX9_001328 [Providencia rettgeri]
MTSNNYGNEDFEAYTYLDYHNLAVSWNIARGSFCSPSEFPYDEYYDSILSVAFTGMLANSTPERLYSELAIDKVRALLFPDCVSRLRGFFVFDEIDSISRFWHCNSWGGHFSDQYLSDVGVAATRSTRVDSNWISHIVDVNGRLKKGWYENAINYWRGDIFPDGEPIWERIVEGYLTVWSHSVRTEAVLEIEAVWPNSLKLLQYSSFCAAYGSLDGMIFPLLNKKDNDQIEVIYMSRMVHANDEDFIEKIIEHAKKKATLDINLNDTTTTDEDISTPDLTFLNVCLSSDDNCAFSDFVQLVSSSQ